MRAALRERLLRRWYGAQSPPLLLRPLAALFGVLAARRKRRLQARAVRLPVPVIVVGNISVGGSGKTPLVIWLVERLRELGWKPGVISRGYGAHAKRYPLLVRADSDPGECGDEPLLIASRTGCPVAVDPDRVAAARYLIDQSDVDVIVADDGLQHYRLARDIEIAVVDGERGLGNGALLPAGPLRERAARLASVDWVVRNGGDWQSSLHGVVAMTLALGNAVHLQSGRSRPLADFAGSSLHAVAGIGHPERFFAALRKAGLEPRRHQFPDHYRFTSQDFDFAGDDPVLMTEKDVVKCRRIADDRLWFVPVTARLADDLGIAIDRRLRSADRRQGPPHARL